MAIRTLEEVCASGIEVAAGKFLSRCSPVKSGACGITGSYGRWHEDRHAEGRSGMPARWAVIALMVLAGFDPETVSELGKHPTRRYYSPVNDTGRNQPNKNSKFVTELQKHGAGDGNRTRMTSLEGWSSTIELRPRGPPRKHGGCPFPSVPSPGP
jgi:hypothetical protein